MVERYPEDNVICILCGDECEKGEEACRSCRNMWKEIMSDMKKGYPGEQW